MSVRLLDRTRKISRLLHDNKSFVVIFNDICRLLGEILSASVMVVSAKGKLLGIYEDERIPSLHELLTENVGENIDNELNDRFLSVLSTKENANLAALGFEKSGEDIYSSVILPIDFAGERLGTTFLYRTGKEFSVDDIILCEYANTVVELEMMRSVYEENEEQRRKSENITAAISSLSQSEKRAVEYVLRSLEGAKEGIVIASRISSEYGITRSIIVNAMQKLESAGVIEVHSKGMKGTHVAVINEAVYNLVM